MKWRAEAPTNIALIKYMGKQSTEINLPANASLSFTLNHLKSFVELELRKDLTVDAWQPLQEENSNFNSGLSKKGQARFIKHLEFVKRQFNFDGFFIIRSANNFPAGCGLASSASSFAALTMCAAKALAELTHKKSLSMAEVANLSRQGSGSSCRSFFEPWALWQGDKVKAVDLPYGDLMHCVVVVSKEHKAVSSSEAHKRVVTSALFEGRIVRAQKRLDQLLQALNNKNWSAAYAIVWQEFWDMHALFETAAQPFGYLQPGSLTVLDYIRHYWENNNDGPLVTLDAGPNVHLLFRADQSALFNKMKADLGKSFLVL